MACYKQAKQRLFLFESLQRAVICADSDYAEAMVEGVVAPVWYYSSRPDKQADLRVSQARFLQAGVALDLEVFGQAVAVTLPLLGEFNIQNALAALAAVWQASSGDVRLLEALATLRGAPGRMEPINMAGAPLVLVDYAHTSDALQVALQAVRAHASGKLICVFGCGGDRDRGKRPLMLQAAQRYANEVWLTSDNPRTEAVQSIIKDALSGQQAGALYIEEDRHKAIASAIAQAAAQDIILIAGKGHETYQDIQGVRYHFDDKEEARKALNSYVARA